MNAWILLICAGLLEIGWVIGPNYAEGFAKAVPSLLTIAAMVASMYLLALAATPARLVSIGMIIAGVVGLKLASPG